MWRVALFGAKLVWGISMNDLFERSAMTDGIIARRSGERHAELLDNLPRIAPPVPFLGAETLS